MTDQENMKAAVPDAARRYMRYLLIMAGLGGLLYGVDVGVIAAALPYIEQTAGFNPSQLSQVVAAVLFGSVLSSLFAGYLADKMGRKALITVAAALFTASIPVICLSQEVFGIMLLGRILQGASAGIVGVVVPLYLAECLSAESRGKGTGMFQFLLTVGLVFAAVVGLLAASYVGGVENSGASEESLTSAKVLAWQAIFWVCAIPGLFLFFGSFRLSESPRYLFRRGARMKPWLCWCAVTGMPAPRKCLMKWSTLKRKRSRRRRNSKSRALPASPFFNASISIPLFWRCSFWRLRRLRVLIPC